MKRMIDYMIDGQHEKYSPHATALFNKIRKVPNYLVSVVFLVSMIVLAGWQWDINMMKRPIPHFPAMNPVSAVLFIFSSFSFFFISSTLATVKKKILGKGLAVIIILVAALRLAGIIFHINPSIDLLFFAKQINAGNNEMLSGRMASATAINFILCGLSLLLLDVETVKKKMPAQLIAIMVAMIGLFFIISFVYRVDFTHGFLSYIPMSVLSAASFLLLAVSILFTNPDKGFMKEITSAYSGGITARYLIPAAIIIPIILGGLRLIAGWKGYLALELGVTLLVLSIVSIFLLLTWHIVRLLNKRDGIHQEAENILRKSDDRIQVIFNTAPDAIIVINDEGRILKWNKKAETLLGWTEKEVIDKPLVELAVPTSLRQIYKKTLHQFFPNAASEVGEVIETFALTKNGQEIDVALSIATTPDVSGKHLLIGFVRDITEQKKADAKFKALLDSAPDAMIISNSTGNIVLINKQTETLFGYDRTELIGKPIEMLIPADFRKKHTGHRDKYFADPKLRSMGAGLELFAIRKDATHFPVEISLSPLQTEEGMLVSAAIRDITERKKSEEKFRSLLNSAPDATVIVNEQGIIEMVNNRTETLFGYTRDEMIGQPVEILIPGELKHKHVHHRADFMNAPRVRAMGAAIELLAVKKNGASFPVEISLSPIQTEEGMLVSASVRDVTTRKELQDELKKSNMEMEAFTYSVSHDLRAPLRGIIGFTAMLEEDYVSKLDDGARRITSIIRSNTLKMGHLIDDLLAFSHTGKREILKATFNTTNVVNEIVTEIMQQPPNGNIQFQIGELPAVRADLATLRQVWVNLIGNAVKYSATKEQPCIGIACYRDKGSIVFYVKDNGVGFDDKYQHKLFKVFQRLHNQEEFEGTGIGLALVERIVSRHGGRVWAEGKENEGACFYFSLPE